MQVQAQHRSMWGNKIAAVQTRHARIAIVDMAMSALGGKRRQHSDNSRTLNGSADKPLGDAARKAQDRPHLEAVLWIGGPIPRR